MRNQFRKPKNVNCAYSVFPKQTNLEAKIHERSEWIYTSTQYEQRCDMSVNTNPQ